MISFYLSFFSTVLREYEETIQTLVAGKETTVVVSPPSDMISSLMREKEQVYIHWSIIVAILGGYDIFKTNMFSLR